MTGSPLKRTHLLIVDCTSDRRKCRPVKCNTYFDLLFSRQVNEVQKSTSGKQQIRLLRCWHSWKNLFVCCIRVILRRMYSTSAHSTHAKRTGRPQCTCEMKKMALLFEIYLSWNFVCSIFFGFSVHRKPISILVAHHNQNTK